MHKRRIAILILAIPSIGLGIAAYRMPSPLDRFVAEFEQNIQNVPIAASVIARDPGFGARVLVATTVAFDKGGWPAADDVLDVMMLEKQPEVTWTLIHADDALVVAAWRRYLETMRQLRDKPGACRYYGAGIGAAGASFPSAGREYLAARDATIAAYKSGLANLDNGTAPELPLEDVANDLLDKSSATGNSFTAAEWAALTPGAAFSSIPDAVICAAMIKRSENLLSLPEAEAAAAIRYEWGHWMASDPPVKHG